MSFDQMLLKKILEGAILSYGDALSVDRMQTLFDESERPEKQEIQEALQSLQQDCQQRGYTLTEVSSGWRFQVEPELAAWVNRLWEEKPQKYSRALLETLALIAYRQPLTRGDIEEVRGVAVSSHIIKTLAEREWIKVVGHRDVPGRPSLFATTKQFLDYFGLKSLEELPTLGELKDIDSLNEKLQLEDDEAALEMDQIEDAKDEGTGESDSDVDSMGVLEESENSSIESEPEVLKEVLEQPRDGTEDFENSDGPNSEIITEGDDSAQQEVDEGMETPSLFADTSSGSLFSSSEAEPEPEPEQTESSVEPEIEEDQSN